MPSTASTTAEPDRITLKHKIDTLRREVRLRQHVYPKLVRLGRMHQISAEHEIEVMRAILDDYEKQCVQTQGELLQ